MKVRADEVRVGDRIGGAMVAWALSLPDRSAVVIAVELDGTAVRAPGCSRTRRYPSDALVSVDERRGSARSRWWASGSTAMTRQSLRS